MNDQYQTPKSETLVSKSNWPARILGAGLVASLGFTGWLLNANYERNKEVCNLYISDLERTIDTVKRMGSFLGYAAQYETGAKENAFSAIEGIRINNSYLKWALENERAICNTGVNEDLREKARKAIRLTDSVLEAAKDPPY